MDFNFVSAIFSNNLSAEYNLNETDVNDETQCIKFNVTIKNYIKRAEGILDLITNDNEVIDNLTEAGFFNLKNNRVFIVNASHGDLRKRFETVSQRIYGLNCIVVTEMRNLGYESLGYHLNQNDLQEHKVFTSSIFFKKPEANMQSTQNQTGLEEAMEKLTTKN